MKDENLLRNYLQMEFLCELGDTAGLCKLAKKGGCVNWHPEGKPSLLSLNVAEGHVDTVRVLVDLGARVEDVNLYEVLKVEMMELLLSLGAPLPPPEEHGWTLLHNACSFGKKELVACLLSWGADTDARDRDNYTPLDVANGNQSICDMLKSHHQQLDLQKSTMNTSSGTRPRRI